MEFTLDVSTMASIDELKLSKSECCVFYILLLVHSFSDISQIYQNVKLLPDHSCMACPRLPGPRGIKDTN